MTFLKNSLATVLLVNKPMTSELQPLKGMPVDSICFNILSLISTPSNVSMPLKMNSGLIS